MGLYAKLAFSSSFGQVLYIVRQISNIVKQFNPNIDFLLASLLHNDQHVPQQAQAAQTQTVATKQKTTIKIIAILNIDLSIPCQKIQIPIST